MMTEREAWTAIADVLEMLEGMPPDSEGVPEIDLDRVRVSMYWHGDIGPRVLRRMKIRLDAEAEKQFGYGSWKSIAALARRFAKECEA